MKKDYLSWGRVHRFQHDIVQPSHQDAAIQNIKKGPISVLPYGLGRSYGDSCLNDQGRLLDTTKLDRFLSFDTATGVIRCESGVSLDACLKVIVPQGWFLPVTPGTRFVTVGGAVANDVHGKNHHRAGTFGRHVRAFELVRSSGEKLLCTPTSNEVLFRATIGGLGLTGLVTWVEFQLTPIQSCLIDCETIKTRDLDDTLETMAGSDKRFEYTVTWLDLLAKGGKLGRGIVIGGEHLQRPGELRGSLRNAALSVPFTAPAVVLSQPTISLFNFGYYHLQWERKQNKHVHYAGFFYPLDAVGGWNRVYGKRGFYQYQFVVPSEKIETLRGIILKVGESGSGSFLSILKTFGSLPSPGVMSFPRPGFTLALDVQNHGDSTLRFLDSLDELVINAGGALYPAKDGRMSPGVFQKCFPQWQEFAKQMDPAFASSFWKRVTGK